MTLADFSGGPSDRRGLRLLEEIDEIGVIAIPDAVLSIAPPLTQQTQIVVGPLRAAPAPPPPPPPDPTSAPATLSDADRNTLQMLMIEQCERLNFRVAVLDPPAGIDPVGDPQWPSSQGLINASAKFAALYFPWLKIADPLNGAVATRERASERISSPAPMRKRTSQRAFGSRPPISFCLRPWTSNKQISNLQQAQLNAPNVNVNAIRAFPGQGVKIWGARTLAADDAWRFIHIRRLCRRSRKPCCAPASGPFSRRITRRSERRSRIRSTCCSKSSGTAAD